MRLFTETYPSNPKSAHTTATEQLQRLRLMRLCSPSLPIGSYTWSQGLETAVERQWIRDGKTAADWLEACLLQTFSCTEGALLLRLTRALQQENDPAFGRWNEFLLALRETDEFYKEDTEQGVLLHRLNVLRNPDCPNRLEIYTLAAAFAESLFDAGIDEEEGLLGFLWMWVEAQVMQVIKLVPLGLRDGQALQAHLLSCIPRAHAISWNCPDEDLGFSLPGRTLASMFHESQYCRIYRS